MKNEFSTWYLALLRKQVDEEIQFLVTNGHNQHRILVACMFCIDIGKDYYTCHRLNELRQFQSSIISHGSSNLRSEHQRKRIGFETEKFPMREVSGVHQLDFINHAELPLLSVDL